MPILDEIEQFFVSQPSWQQHAYQALRAGRVQDAQLVSDLTELCIKEAGDEPISKLPTKPAITSSEVSPPIVNLLGVENVQHINNLAAGQKLSFAKDGLTVVYGNNGAGKTGYGKIVRQVCQARGVTPMLRGNVFADSVTTGQADIVFSIDGTEERVTIDAGKEASVPLRHFSIFDSSAANALVNDQNATAFRPFGLDLLDRYTNLADAVKQCIEQKLAKIATPLIEISAFGGGAKATQLAKHLESESGRKNIESDLLPLSDEQQRRMEEVRHLIANARNNDPLKQAQGINAKATRYEHLNKRVEFIISAFNESELKIFIELLSETREAEKAAEVARTKAFEKEPLLDVGSSVWQQLWNAARLYSNQIREDKPFSEVKMGDLCVLCAQPLSTEAADRFHTLESFVKGELQAKAKGLRVLSDNNLQRFNELPLVQPGDDVLDQELAADSPDAVTEFRSFFSRAKEFLKLVQTLHTREGCEFAAPIPLVIPPSLSALPQTLRQRATALQETANPEVLKALQAELANLDSSAKIFDSSDQIKKEVGRLRDSQLLEKAKRFSTRSVSELSKRLTTKYVSDALCERFKDEVRRLGLTHLDVQLAPSDTQKGKLFHRITLKAKHEAPLREIVSEGEFRCLALAAFLAEAGSNSSGILFDDPVSSLDHAWRQTIARRVAEEAQDRQVIVFTHDIVFHFLLRESAESPSIQVSLTERCVERRGSSGAGYCRDDAPWAGLVTTKRIGVLKNDLVGLARQHKDGDTGYEVNARDWYGRLRESWERAIEECLFNDAIRRFRQSVETNRLKKALQKISTDDWTAIEKGMTQTSCAIRGHDGAIEQNPPVPTPDQAKIALDDFEAWVKTKK